METSEVLDNLQKNSREPITVYRVEHYLGQGYLRSPKKDNNRFQPIRNRHISHRFPNIWDDYQLRNDMQRTCGWEDGEPEGYRFSYPNEEYLYKALTKEEILYLIEEGHQVYKYLVNNYFKSPYQVIFINPLEKANRTYKVATFYFQMYSAND